MSEVRLAELVRELRRHGAQILVIGGHAARHYGVQRTTIDFDFVTSGFAPVEVAMRGASEGPTWRPGEFRRFVTGMLPDGAEERAEFWLTNHLLAPFDALWSRRETATVQGVEVPFIGLDDLVRSKETEREDDWDDVALLEEIADERRRATGPPSEALVHMRSRRGFDAAHRSGLYAGDVMSAALAIATHPLSCAWLAPFGPIRTALAATAATEIIRGPLARVEPGSARHLALVEAVRRLYRADCIAADRRDKARFAL